MSISPLHIVYVTNSIDFIGGIETVTFEKCNYFVSLGHRVTIVVSDSNGDNKIASRLDSRVSVVDTGTRLFEYNNRRNVWDRIRGLFKPIVLYCKLKRTLNAIAPDVVISVGKSEKFILPIIAMGKKWVVIREYHFDKNYRRQYAHFQDGDKVTRVLAAMVGYGIEHYVPLPSYDATVVLTRQDHEENWKLSRKVRVIPNPVSFCGKASPGTKEKIVVSLSRVIRVKRLDHLIKAWQMLHEHAPGWKLEIWGPSDGDYEEELKRLIREMKLDNEVILCGPTYDAASVLSKSSIFAFSSAYEGFGLVLVEAMSCGLPCVSYTCPCGPKDIISDGVDGLWVENGNVEDMAEKLLVLIRDEKKRNAMGQAAIEKSRLFSMERIGAQWLTLFEELLARKRK